MEYRKDGGVHGSSIIKTKKQNLELITFSAQIEMTLRNRKSKLKVTIFPAQRISIACGLTFRYLYIKVFSW